MFCPYQYVVNPGMRESLGINIENSIVVVDEAHNIEDTCREAGSIDMSVSNFIEIMRDLCILHAHFDNRGLALEAQGATHVMLFFQNALQWLMVKGAWGGGGGGTFTTTGGRRCGWVDARVGSPD